MTPDRATRPRQVTIGAVLAAFGGAVLVLGLYDTLGATQSAEVRRQLAETLQRPPTSGLGLDIEQALTLVRGLITLLAVTGGLSVVFAVFTLLGDARARWGLLVCAVIVFIGSPLAMAGLLGLGVTLGTILVFSGPGRDWFAGRPIRDVTTTASRGTPRTTPAPPGAGAAGEAPSVGAPATRTTAALADAGRTRPRAVTEACVVTWVGCLVATLLCSSLLVATAVAREVFVRQIETRPEVETLGVDAATLVSGAVVMAAVGLVWSLAVALLTLAVWRRVQAAAIALMVSAGITVLVALLALPWGVLNAGLAAFALARLLRRDSRAWLAGD